MCYPVCELVHIKDPLLLIEKCSGRNRFPLLLYEVFTICLTQYNRIENVLSVLVLKRFPSFLLISPGSHDWMQYDLSVLVINE